MDAQGIIRFAHRQTKGAVYSTFYALRVHISFFISFLFAALEGQNRLEVDKDILILLPKALTDCLTPFHQRRLI